MKQTICSTIAKTTGMIGTDTGAATTLVSGWAPASRLVAAFASLPATAAAISVAGAPYWYANGVYYGMQAGKYVVVPPPEGAVVTTPPPSCSVIYAGDSPKLDCGGAFYAHVANGYQVIPPPIGSTVTKLPNGAVSENIKGAYFRFGDAYYRPFYSGSSVIYKVVAKPG
jgi:hypothetical protein